jgi:hypothetical protein
VDEVQRVGEAAQAAQRKDVERPARPARLAGRDGREQERDSRDHREVDPEVVLDAPGRAHRRDKCERGHRGRDREPEERKATPPFARRQPRGQYADREPDGQLRCEPGEQVDHRHRVHEDTRKFYFTLIDLRGATSHFADPEFDGEPVQIYEPGDGDPIAPPEDAPATTENGDILPEKPAPDETIVDGPPTVTLPLTGSTAGKIYVDGVGASIIAERVEYLDANGKLVTESLRDFTKKALKKRFASLDSSTTRTRSWSFLIRSTARLSRRAFSGAIGRRTPRA